MKFKYYYHLLNWIDDTLSWKGEGETHNFAVKKQKVNRMGLTSSFSCMVHELSVTIGIL